MIDDLTAYETLIDDILDLNGALNFSDLTMETFQALADNIIWAAEYDGTTFVQWWMFNGDETTPTYNEDYLYRFENVLEAKPIRISGTARHLDDSTMGSRVNAIQYCIAHDDGSRMKDYDEAEVILLGVSRSGKTPISVYLATQMGIKAANYPLVAEDLNSYRLPNEIVRNKKRQSASPQHLKPCILCGNNVTKAAVMQS